MSAFAFAASHLTVVGLPGCANIFLVGCMLGTVAVAAEGNLAAPFLAHALYNSALFAGELSGVIGAR